jgi:UPF0755 protein
MSGDKRSSGGGPPKLLAVMPRSPAEALAPTRAPTRPRRPRSHRESRRLSPALRAVNGLLTFLAISLGLAGALTFWMGNEIAKPGPLKEAKGFVVRKGDGSRDIAHRLEQDGIVASQQMFILHYIGRTLASWFGSKPLQLKAGEYEIPAGSSIQQVAEVIGEGRSVLYRFAAPEGLTSHQIVERLRADQALTGDIAAVPAEGVLLPETYKVPRGATRQSLLELMQGEHRKVLEAAWAARQQDLPIKTVEEAVVLASIVERETGRNDKHADIASVFINRLRRGMQLQSDPTILYGLAGGQVAWGKPIQKADIQSRTPYNTYVIKGLPPTPICNPSRLSLQAVLNPSHTNYLYFVASGNGSSVFSQTIEEHNVAVAQWRKVEQSIRAKQAEADRARAAAGASAAPQPAGAEVQAPAGSAVVQPATAPGQPAQTAQTAPAQPAAAPVAPTPASVNVPLPIRKPKK